LFFCACISRPIEQALLGIDQQPRQMPFSLRSMALFSSLMAASSLVCELVPAPADPVVTPRPVLAPPPDDWAVPAELVPGAGGEASLGEFPAPPESWPTVFDPPELPGPDGTPLAPEVPVPAELPAGEPAALPLPAGDPLVLCANEVAGDIKIMIAATATVAEALFIGISFSGATTAPRALFLLKACS
jgi:hypothetical protein